jgi:ABC-2 type transport system ATP-binding protein
VLLLDEPASGLDPEARSSLAGVFSELQAQGMSILVSSHILAELDEYSTHMLALNEGRVLEHRALRTGANPFSNSSGELLLRLEFLDNAPQAQQWLQTRTNVQIYRSDGQGIDIGLRGTLTDQADLVAACIQAQHRLTMLTPTNENLQQSYLNSLAAARSSTTRPTP